MTMHIFDPDDKKDKGPWHVDIFLEDANGFLVGRALWKKVEKDKLYQLDG